MPHFGYNHDLNGNLLVKMTVEYNWSGTVGMCCSGYGSQITVDEWGNTVGTFSIN